jgi:hypothetical protein
MADQICWDLSFFVHSNEAWCRISLGVKFGVRILSARE